MRPTHAVPASRDLALRPAESARPRSLQPKEADDGLAAYLDSVARQPAIGRAAQKRLLRAYRQTRDPALAQELVLGNMRLVVKIATEYRRSGADLRDLIQEGVLGLMRAVEKFDLDQGVQLSTYAALWIRAYLLRYVTRNWRQVKIGTTQAQRRIFFNLPEELRRLEQGDRSGEERREAAAVVIGRRLGVKADEVESLMQRLATRELSLDAPIERSGGGITHVDQLAAEESWQPDQRVESSILTEQLQRCLAELRPGLDRRETLILDGRLLADESLTLEAIARQVGMTREGVRQIERRLIRRLKDLLAPTARAGRSEAGALPLAA